MTYEQAVPIIENILDDKQVEYTPSLNAFPAWRNDTFEWGFFNDHKGVLKFSCFNIENNYEEIYHIPVTDNFKQILELLENN